MITEPEDILLQQCKTLIENKLGWGNSSQWTNQDFEGLSQRIFEATGVNLSPTTLKRIWGKVKYDSAPTNTTLNTLAQYIGYENWRDFRQNQVSAGTPLAEPPVPVTVTPDKARKQPYLFSFILPLLIILGALGWYFISRKDVNTSAQLNPADYEFSSKKVISSGVPNSVIFDYDASRAPDDSIYIQQSWDASKRVKVSRNQHQHTSIYYYPGFFQAKLVIGHQVVKEHNLFIKTNGWLPLIEQEPVPVYMKPEDAIHDGVLGVSIEKIKARNINLQPVAPAVHYVNLKDMGDIETDNFIYETSVKNTYREGAAVCQYSEVGLICEGSAILIRLSAKGCISENNLFFIDHNISGKEHDLSGFGVSFNEPVKVKCESVKGQVKIWVNDKVAYTFPYKSPKSKIVGFTYRFQGSGQVDNVKLTKGDGKSVYEDNFDAIIR